MWDEDKLIIIVGVVLLVFSVVFLSLQHALKEEILLDELIVDGRPCIAYMVDYKIEALTCDWSAKDE